MQLIVFFVIFVRIKYIFTLESSFLIMAVYLPIEAHKQFSVLPHAGIP